MTNVENDVPKIIHLDGTLQDSSLSGWTSSSSVESHFQSGTDTTGNTSSTSMKEQNHAAHPIDRVPSELWYLIFQPLTNPNDNPGHVDGIMSMRYGAWPLSQVCQQWRSMVIGMPNLWSNIEFYQPLPQSPLYRTTGYEAMVQLLFHRLALQLERSDDMPLHITFIGTQTQSDTLQAIYHPIYQLLLKRASLWEEVHFSNPYPNFDAIVRNALGAATILERPLFPILRSFKWCSPWQWGNGALLPAHAPKLESFSTYSAQDKRPPFQDLSLLPPRLRRLELTNFQAIVGISVLRRLCGSLKDLTIALEDIKVLTYPSEWTRLLWPPVDLRPRVQITFTRLQKMRLAHGLAIPVFKHLLECITAPALETLELATGYGTDEAHELVNFISLSHCSLKSLTLDFRLCFSSQMTSDHLVGILSATPHLEYLEISAYLPVDRGEPILAAILALLGNATSDSTEVRICPNLGTLRLRTYEQREGSAYLRPLADVVQSRFHGVKSTQSLRQVYLESVRGWNDAGKEETRLRKLKDAGLDIAIWLGREGYFLRRRLL